jgi:predicted alpha-1,2-mannosidase
MRCKLLQLVRCGVLGLLAIGAALFAHAEDFARHVNPFIGTDGTGHVFPGAVVPFGMVQPGPDNADRGWSFSSGYQYRAPRVLGFSNTHISGAGIPELGDVLLQPRAGMAWSAETEDFSAAIVKATEQASPGHYGVRLAAHGVRVDLTATQRVALQRYTFDSGGMVQVLVDLQHGLHFVDRPRVTAASARVDKASAEVVGTVFSSNWVTRQASFVVRFDRAPISVMELPARSGEKAPRYVLTFDLGAAHTLEARIALSTVDEAGARNNLSEAQNQSFSAVRRAALAAWNDHLGRIELQAPAAQKRIFYSALYRTMIHPSNIADLDRRVRGPQGGVISAEGGVYYSTLSLWDTFRAVHPLLTLIAPERVDGFVNTLLEHHAQQGYLPLWTAWGRETWTMIGNPALPVIADAMAKDFRGFDRAAALRAMVETSTALRPQAPAWALRDWGPYERLGYLPFDLAPGESVSKSLEYGVGDAAVALAAQLQGDVALAARFAARAAGYSKLFDVQTQAMRGRDSLGRWRTPFDPLAATSPMNNPGDYTEANALQYTLTPALHDPDGLAALIGGPAAFEAWLDRFFATKGAGENKFLGQEALIGQYAHGNEPSHHIAYLYAWTPSPWKGHALIRRIAKDFYADDPAGLIGNDDCGQMSAWLVLATLGLYPVEPGEGVFTAGVPLAARAVVFTGRSRRLEIVARGPRAGYGAQVTLNGAPLDPRRVMFAPLAAGGRLEFTLRPAPGI